MRDTISYFYIILGFTATTTVGKSPNFLLVVGDDVGYNDVSWNNPAMKTPVLDSLRKEGVTLDSFYSQPRCSPSRASLLTGLYPYKMGIQRGNISPFRPSGLARSLTLLPEMLAERGYCSEEYLPTNRGFHSFFGQLTERADHYTRLLVTNEHIGPGYDLWSNQTVSYEGAG